MLGFGCGADGDAAVGCLRCWGWDAGGRRGWADGDDVRTAFAVRGGARRQLCGACGVCVSRETRCLSCGWRATSLSIFSA
ncbi:hypothetical protein HMPREF1978_00154 [Actinomyces graevenitzii F0530]|uniref:Uncharacterized protein n=1 Tax=Actinomyces graevenitzii F0530 TaxID=1321817 RepID=U1QC81_9ACTO|nr:hypothetical protein HMPREF1978_00154 [Actinomyces graevenitzii F0530]